MNKMLAAVGAIALLPMAAVAQSQMTAATGDAGAQPNPQPQISLVPIAPGPADPVNEVNPKAREYASDPAMSAAGGQLYQAYNCVGCHFNGGGGMGPPLMDNTWIYGGEVEHIIASIREGRPGGMPSYRTLAPEEQLWQLAAFVKSLSAETEQGAGTGAGGGTGNAGDKGSGTGMAGEKGPNP